jgi:hypothetical protein
VVPGIVWEKTTTQGREFLSSFPVGGADTAQPLDPSALAAPSRGFGAGRGTGVCRVKNRRGLTPPPPLPLPVERRRRPAHILCLSLSL